MANTISNSQAIDNFLKVVELARSRQFSSVRSAEFQLSQEGGIATKPTPSAEKLGHLQKSSLITLQEKAAPQKNIKLLGSLFDAYA